MRLDFRILWIDDQPKHVASFADGIRRTLKELGFNLDLIEYASLEKVREYIGAHVHDDGIDLVLVDFDLGHGSGDGGQKVLAAVRERFPYKDIIFYSATDTHKLREIAYCASIDGVYFSTRLSLVDDAREVINNLLKKTLDLDHMRGVVMSATSDIDYMVEKSLVAVYDRLNEAEKEKFLNEATESIREKLDRYAKEVEKASGKNDFSAILKLKHLFTAADRLDSLYKELSSRASAGVSGYLDQVRIYQKEVIPRRNKLAHAMLRNVDGRQVLVGADEPISLEEMTSLRCELIDHRINIESIAVLVDVKLD
ncbi:TPA: response regulator [Pseudomonas aeruginosa]|nr:response regulator [Pseudomonas aeruginosa]